MKINQNEDYMQATQQLNTLQMNELQKKSAANNKIEATEKSGESKPEGENLNKENRKNLQGGLESAYLDRTQPNRSSKVNGSSEPNNAESSNAASAKAESKGVIAKLDVSNVEAELKRLKEQLAKAQQQAQHGDESAKARIAQLEAEIKQKDSKEYKKAHGTKSATPM
jgi:hypothetical protein